MALLVDGYFLCFWTAITTTVLGMCEVTGTLSDVPCLDLFPSMYCCVEPVYNPTTFQPVGCQRNNTFLIDCFRRHGVECDGIVGVSSPDYFNDSVNCGQEWYNRSDVAFRKEEKCFYVNEDNIYDFDTTLALSIFFGMFGFDRFYLGYYALGLTKLLTLGGFFVGQLIDIILITLQIVGPADGTSYRIPFNGPRMIQLFPDNNTYYPHFN
eukprot:gene10440-2571_t